MHRGVDYDVRAWLNRMGLNMTHAADLIDCSRRSIQRWVNGQARPDAYSVRQMRRLELHRDAGKSLQDAKPSTFRRRARKLAPPPISRETYRHSLT